MDQRLPNEMTNSHILVQDFDYLEPASVDEAIKLMASYGKNAKLMAGGTHLLTMLKMERDEPTAIISLNCVSGFNSIVVDDKGGLTIGAGATIYDIRSHPYIQANYPALSEACASFGSTQIQIMGTLGGNLCNGSPASDTVPALLIYEAQLVLKSASGERRLPLAEFLLGPGKTALKENEVLTAVVLSAALKGASSAFLKVSRVAADLAKASIAVLLVRDGAKVVTSRIACGSVAPTVMRSKKAEAALESKLFSPESLTVVAKVVSEEVSPIDDVRSTAWYRRQLMVAMVTDALNLAWERSDKKVPASKLGIEKPKAAQPIIRHNIKAGEVQDVVLKINGRKRQLRVASNELLLNVLRDQLGLTGAKYGCGLGECGACTVLMDGKAALSCLVLASAAEGHEIVTIEGLQKPNGELDPLQQDFVEEAAFQCGYCTPGFIMTAKSMLKDLPKPNEDQIRDYLKGNRCRCTGYAAIMRAVIKSVQRQ
ncbi:MAG: FAD binding domain-containing protein [Leptolinea sp.]